MDRYDAAGTAHNPDVSGPTEQLQLRWEARTRPSFSTQPERPLSPIRIGTAVYVAGSGFVALDADSGDTRFRIEGTHNSAPTWARAERYETGTVVTATEEATVGYNAGGGISLLGNAGARRWQTTPSPEQSTPSPISLDSRSVVPVSAAGTVYVPTGESNGTELLALDPNSGAVQWQFESSPPKDALPARLLRPAVQDGMVYAVSATGAVLAVTAEDGTQQWEGYVGSSPGPATATPAGLLVPYAEGLALFDPDGTVLWDRSLGEYGEVTAAAATDERAAVVHEHTLSVLDIATGEQLWTAEGFVTTPVIADGVVYVPGRGQLAGFDLDTGDRLFTYDHSERLQGPLSPPVVGDGRLYCNSFSRTIALEHA
jgi:outer membrane protein assembly factor BamB